MKFKALRIGDRARITGFDQKAKHYRQKLLSMGLTPGTEFTLQRLAPLGDPAQISLRGFELSLRRSEADILELEKV